LFGVVVVLLLLTPRQGLADMTFPICERFAGLLISMKGCRTNRSVLKSWRASPDETAAC
jgi:hypothetical protein